MDRLRSPRDLVSGTALLALSVLYYVAASDLPAAEGEPGPAFLPKLLAAALFSLAATIVVGGLRGCEREAAAAPVAQPLLAIALTLAYAYAYGVAGFFPATLGYTFALAAVFGVRSARRLVGIAVATTVFIFAALGWGLGIPL